MPRLKLILAMFALLLSTLACAALFGEGPAPDVSIAPGEETGLGLPPTPEVRVEAACPVITDRIVETNLPVDLSNDMARDFNNAPGEEDETAYIATYLVSGDEIGDPYYENVPADLQDEQNDAAAHQMLWDYFTKLIPFENRPTLAEFSIMTDGRENVLAAAAQTYDDPYRWRLEVDIADADDYYSLTFTLVHEFAHLLTLAPDQTPPSLAIFNNPEDNDIYLQEVSACSTFFPGEGCSSPDSYINAFYDRFWKDIYNEWNEINLIVDEDEYYKALDDFYLKYEDRFLTDYSVTHPAEDIAEAFGFFVFAGQPGGNTIADQKILFFYRYPELVQLRSKILDGTCANFPQMP